MHLFHADSPARLRVGELREAARQEVITSSLIRRSYTGELAAARAMHIGFWYFVYQFELAIDRKNLHRHRHPLQEKFGAEAVAQRFRAIADAVREMKEEEGSHASHWKKDAAELGVPELVDAKIPCVHALVDAAHASNLSRFFSVLAGTEFIAEELSRFLVSSDAFTNLFGRKRWMWGEVHLAPHPHGPSHLDIDLDLARAYAPDDDIDGIRRMILETVRLFGEAARDVESRLAPERAVA